jgi:anti-sigma regulatory factor (Ser/Thr protein kinase)
MTNQDIAPGSGSAVRFRTGAAMLSRLGSEQLKDEITAVLELVKNAYDADATDVTVELRENPDGQALRIQDNGAGMTEADLHQKWGLLATENKVREDRSPMYRRPRLGQKGVGRFATEKLGHELVLRTSREGQSTVLQVKFDWDQLTGDRELSEYSFPIKRKPRENFEPLHGTRLDIRRLRIRWTRARFEKLRSQLCHLIDPEASSTDFRIRVCSSWEDLNGLLHNPLPGNETHRLNFELNSDGRETIRVFANGKEYKEVRQIEGPVFGPVTGRLRYFGQGLKRAERGRGGDDYADWNVGVRVFRDGCRVRPYGEPGAEGDWLQIYRERYWRGVRFRLKPHYLEGTIHITRQGNPGLRDTTSREGLEVTECFDAFVEYVRGKVAALSEMLRDEELREERSRIQERYKHALQPLTTGLSQVRSDLYRRAVEAADKVVKRKLTLAPPAAVIRNAHWECLDCHDSWKAPRDLMPTRCREFSVGRDGLPTNKPGCGSVNIRRKENLPGSGESMPPSHWLEDVIAAAPAYVSGIQLKPEIDWGMGEKDEEAEVRPDRRELAVNGRHPAFRTADSLDGNETTEGTAYELLRANAALVIHLIHAAAEAWGRWHYHISGRDFEEYLKRSAELKTACLAACGAATTAAAAASA